MALHVFVFGARGMSLPLSGEARASGLLSSLAFLLKRRGQASQAPPSAQAPHPR
jgi:hypothetical protein